LSNQTGSNNSNNQNTLKIANNFDNYNIQIVPIQTSNIDLIITNNQFQIIKINYYQIIKKKLISNHYQKIKISKLTTKLQFKKTKPNKLSNNCI